MTLYDLIKIISLENHDNTIAIVDYSGQEMISSSIYDILHDEIKLTLRQNREVEVLSSLTVLYQIAAMLDFEIEENSLKVSSIGYIEQEQSDLPFATDNFLLKILRKPVIGYSVRLKAIGNIQELNWACYCYGRGMKYDRDDIYCQSRRLDNHLRSGGFI